MDPQQQLMQLMQQLQQQQGYAGYDMVGGGLNLPFPPSGASAGVAPLGPSLTGNSLFDMAIQVLGPTVYSAATGQNARWMPQRGPGMSYFDAAYATDITNPLLRGAQQQMAMRLSQGVGNDMARIGMRMGLSTETTNSIRGFFNSDVGGMLTQVAYGMGAMRGISGGDPMQGFAELYQRRDMIFTPAGTPRSYVTKDAQGNTVFDINGELRMQRQTMSLGNELFANIYGVNASPESRIKAMTDVLSKEGKTDLVASLQSTYKTGGISGVEDLLATAPFTAGGLGSRMREAAYTAKTTPNLGFTQGFAAEDVIGTIPALLAARNAAFTDSAGKVQSFRGNTAEVQTGMVKEALKSVRVAADLFQSEDMNQLLQALDKMSSGTWTRVNQTQVQSTLRGMSAFAATLNMTSNEFANIAVTTQQGMVAATGAAYGSPDALRSASGRYLGGMGGEGGLAYASYVGGLVATIASNKGDLTPQGIQDAMALQVGMKQVVEGSQGGRAIRLIEMLRDDNRLSPDSNAYRNWRQLLASGAPVGELRAAERDVFAAAGLEPGQATAIMNNNATMTSFMARVKGTDTEKIIHQLDMQTAVQEFGQRMTETGIALHQGAITGLSARAGLSIPRTTPALAQARVQGIRNYLLDQANAPGISVEQAQMFQQAAGAVGAEYLRGEAIAPGHGMALVTALQGTAGFQRLGVHEMNVAGSLAEADARLAMLERLTPEAAGIKSELNAIGSLVSPEGRRAYSAAVTALGRGDVATARAQMRIAEGTIKDQSALTFHQINAKREQSAYKDSLEAAKGSRELLRTAMKGGQSGALIMSVTEGAIGSPLIGNATADYATAVKAMQAYNEQAKDLAPVMEKMEQMYGIEAGGRQGFIGRMVEFLTGTEYVDSEGKVHKRDLAYALGLRVMDATEEKAIYDKTEGTEADKQKAVAEARLHGGMISKETQAKLAGLTTKELSAMRTDKTKMNAWLAATDLTEEQKTSFATGLTAAGELGASKYISVLTANQATVNARLEDAAKNAPKGTFKQADTGAATGKDGASKDGAKQDEFKLTGTLILIDGATKAKIATADVDGKAKR